ncbi:hypothetical protein [Sphingomonas sp. KR3-1]|uniref:hypothetical protein n=1 Tax=Sphingomonas sp. KR3-1 TaxID=3156611 RepID=UPI0032B4D6C5
MFALFGAPAARAQDFVPPAGYSSGGGPRAALATPVEPGTPRLSHVAEETLAGLFTVDPDYKGFGEATAKVIGAYVVDEPRGAPLREAWAVGFLPVNLAFSNGSCFRFGAEYEDGKLANARLSRSDCSARRPPVQQPGPAPADSHLHWLAGSWGFGAWGDDRTGQTRVTVPFGKVFTPFFSARLKPLGFMAMNSIDAPLGNVTMVAGIDGKLTIVTLLVSY